MLATNDYYVILKFNNDRREENLGHNNISDHDTESWYQYINVSHNQMMHKKQILIVLPTIPRLLVKYGSMICCHITTLINPVNMNLKSCCLVMWPADKVGSQIL